MITHRNVEHRVRNYLLKAHWDIESMIIEFNDLCQMANQSMSDKRRVKEVPRTTHSLGQPIHVTLQSKLIDTLDTANTFSVTQLST
jgi:hypothetical protein